MSVKVAKFEIKRLFFCTTDRFHVAVCSVIDHGGRQNVTVKNR